MALKGPEGSPDAAPLDPKLTFLDPKRVNRLKPGQPFHISPDLSTSKPYDETWDEVAEYKIHVSGIGRGRLRVMRFVDLFHNDEFYVSLLADEKDSYIVPVPIKPDVTMDDTGLSVTPETCPLEFEVVFNRPLGRRTYNALRVDMNYGGVGYEADPIHTIEEIEWEPKGVTEFWAMYWKDPKDGRSKSAYFPSDPEVVRAIEFVIHKDKGVKPKPKTEQASRQPIEDEETVPWEEVKRRSRLADTDTNKPSELSDDQLDAVLMLALDDPNLELPGFDDFLDRYAEIIAPSGPSPSEAEVRKFLKEAGRLALIKKERPLTWREYLGAFLPPR